ncbi:MAG: DUF2231 domain-containing protein [Candidatus Rokuibacteriota bacterium]
MSTPASIEKHPIHPMLVVFPLGLLLAAVVFDVLTLLTGAAIWRTLAFYNIAAGLVGGVLAAVPGLIDYVTLVGRARTIGTYHMVVNVATLALFAVSFVLRTQWGTQWVPAGSSLPQALTIIGAALLGAGGWLGGQLVYVHGIGVEAVDRAQAEAQDAKRRRAA